jgi:hypothetical protein
MAEPEKAPGWEKTTSGDLLVNRAKGFGALIHNTMTICVRLDHLRPGDPLDAIPSKFPVAMTPQQAIELGEALIGMAKRVLTPSDKPPS